MARPLSIRQQVANRLGRTTDELNQALQAFGTDVEGALLSFGTDLADLFSATGKLTPRTRRALRRNYAKEYTARTRAARETGVPLKVARGHGEVPVRLARRLEAQRRGTARKPIPRKTFDKYRKGIAQYQKRYWGEFEVGTHALGQTRTRPLPRTFRSEQEAYDYLEEQGYPTTPDYVTVRQLPTGRWIVILLH